MNTNTITTANVSRMKIQVLNLNTINNLMDIEANMSHFDYQNETVETVVFSFLRSELHLKEAAAKKEFAWA